MAARSATHLGFFFMTQRHENKQLTTCSVFRLTDANVSRVTRLSAVIYTLRPVCVCVLCCVCVVLCVVLCCVLLAHCSRRSVSCGSPSLVSHFRRSADAHEAEETETERPNRRIP